MKGDRDGLTSVRGEIDSFAAKLLGGKSFSAWVVEHVKVNLSTANLVRQVIFGIN